MSKDADKESAESLDAEPARRRRKKTGLRIPSDNVPRSASAIPVAEVDADDMYEDEEDGQSDGVVSRVDADPDLEVEVARDGDPGEDAEDDGIEIVSTWGSVVHVEAGAKHRAPTEPPQAETTDEDDGDRARTRRMPAVQLHELGLSNEELGDLGDELGADGIDIPIHEDEPEEVPAPRPSARERASTVALSDDDLEELIEPLEAAYEARRAREQLRAGGQSEVASEEMPAERSSTSDGKEPLASTPGGAPASEPQRRRSPMPEPGVPAAVAALEGAGMESPLDSPLELGAVALGDAGDSGELLSDDLIEEVDDSDVEVEQATDPRAATPPAPPSSAPVARKPPPAPARGSGGSVTKPADAAGSGKVKRRKGKPWFEELFDEDYLRTLPFLTPQATQAEAAFVASALGVEPGSQVLDIGCGYGRHAMELAARGYHVVALDLSLPLLLRGADEAQRRGLNINFVHGDMRDLNFEDQFDGAYCLFSTFGYFDDDANRRALAGIARALRPGARLVIEVLNRDYLITDLPARVWWEGDGCVVLEEVDFNYFSSRIVSSRSVVFDDGRQLEHEISMRAYSLHELGKLMQGTGLRVVEISGSMATRGRFFGNKSREIIAIAEKRLVRDERAGSQTGLFPRAATAADS